jgi:hypothetical protein
MKPRVCFKLRKAHFSLAIAKNKYFPDAKTGDCYLHNLIKKESKHFFNKMLKKQIFDGMAA